MPIEVEGVTTKASPKAPQVPVQPPEPAKRPTAQDVWELRYRALSAALMGNHVNFNAEQVVARAQVFESYLLSGGPNPVEMQPTVTEQIAQQFSRLTGSLDGNPV